MRTRSVAAALLALGACAQLVAPKREDVLRPEVKASAVTRSAPATSLQPAAMVGVWRLETLNGAGFEAAGAGEDVRRTPRFVFSESGYGGSVGCNVFGGMGLLEGDRFYTSPGAQTVMGCGDLTLREKAATRLMADSPRVSLGLDGRITLTGASGTATLGRDPVLAKAVEGLGLGRSSVWRDGAATLEGANLQVFRIDGRYLTPRSQTDERPLRFGNDGTWSGRAACATLSGSWRQEGDRIALTGPTTTTEQLCPPDEAAIDAALAALMAARPRFVRVPHAVGSVLIAGGGHWLAAGEDYRFRKP